MIHTRSDYHDRIQDIDLKALKALFEEMLEALKADYLAGYTDSKGQVHPTGLKRWERDDRYYRGTFAKIMTGKIPADEPVFLLRAQDVCAAGAVTEWVRMNEMLRHDPLLKNGVDEQCLETARKHVDLMLAWPKRKVADL